MPINSALQPTRRASRRTATAWIAVILLATGCAGPRLQPDAPPRPVDWPAEPRIDAQTRVFTVDSRQSALRVRVDPEGPMAKFGHSHVIGGPALSGRVLIDDNGNRSAIDLVLAVEALEVDRPQWRVEAGLKREIDDASIRGTRTNLLGPRVLDASRHPEIRIRGAREAGPAWRPRMRAVIRLRGEIREIIVPVAVELNDHELVATGGFAFDHADFGMQPFSAAGGALRVAEKIHVEFKIIALESEPTLE